MKLEMLLHLKKGHPCGSKEWEILKSRCRFSPEMHGLWTPDHGSAEDGGEKHKKSSKKGKIMLYSLTKSMLESKIVIYKISLLFDRQRANRP